MTDIFLSYSRDDQTTARQFAAAFKQEGLDVWWDATLRSGEAYDQVTERALREAKAVVVLWSKKSVDSRWVRSEATIGDRNHTFVPVMIEPCNRPVMFELTQTADLSGWKGDTQDPRWRTFVDDVRAFTHAGAHVAAPAFVPPAATHKRRAQRGPLIAAAAGVAVLAIAAAAWFLLRSPAAVVPMPASVAAVPASTAYPRTSVAVMPFANLTGDAGMDYMGDGMAVELIDVLGKVPELMVPSRTSTFAYRTRNADLRQISKDLQVGTVLEGSVRSAGAIIRVTASLIDAQTDRQLWSESYERDAKDLFRLQDELARAIVAALQVRLSERSAATAPPTSNVEAYRLLLRGTQLTPQWTFTQSLADLDAAIALDPRFARAWAGRANVQMGSVVQGIADASLLEKVEADARQALSLDPMLGTVQSILAAVEAYRGNWLAADAGFRRGIEADLREPGSRFGYASLVLQSVGHLRRGLSEIDISYRLAPANPQMAYGLSGEQSIMGNDAEALRFAELATVLGMPREAVPLPQVRAAAATRAGRHAEAAELLARSLYPPVAAVGGAEVIRAVYAALADPSRKPAAIKALDDFIARVGVAGIDMNFRKDVLVMHVQLRDLDRAYSFGNRVLDEYRKKGGVGYAWGALWIPEMRPFRQDARFQKFAERMNLPAYWQVHGAPDGCTFEKGRVTCRE